MASVFCKPQLFFSQNVIFMLMLKLRMSVVIGLSDYIHLGPVGL